MSRYNIVGKLNLKFDTPWGISDPSVGVSEADIEIRKIGYIDYDNHKFDSIPLKVWISGSTLKGTLRGVAYKFSGENCKYIDSLLLEDNEDTSGSNCNCVVCRLFGSGKRKGKIRISAATLPIDTFIKPHTRINRKKRTVDEKALFFIENNVDAELSIDILAVDLEEDEKQLLEACLNLWGEYGIGINHVPFNVEGINKLTYKEVK